MSHLVLEFDTELAETGSTGVMTGIADAEDKGFSELTTYLESIPVTIIGIVVGALHIMWTVPPTGEKEFLYRASFTPAGRTGECALHGWTSLTVQDSHERAVGILQTALQVGFDELRRFEQADLVKGAFCAHYGVPADHPYGDIDEAAMDRIERHALRRLEHVEGDYFVMREYGLGPIAYVRMVHHLDGAGNEMTTVELVPYINAMYPHWEEDAVAKFVLKMPPAWVETQVLQSVSKTVHARKRLRFHAVQRLWAEKYASIEGDEE